MRNTITARDRVLVTGAGGFIGAAAVRSLVSQGCEVRAVSLETEPVRIKDLLDRVEYIAADMADPAVIERAVDRVDYALHFAARGVVWDPSDSFEELMNANVLGTYRLIMAAGKAGVGKVVVAGSVFEYGRDFGRRVKHDIGTRTALSPINLYGVTKAASTLCVPHAGDLAGVETEALRIFSPYGPAEHPGRFVPSVIVSSLRGEPVLMTGGEQERDFCYSEDIANAFIAAARTARGECSTYNLGTGRAISLREAAEVIVSSVGSRVEIRAGQISYRKNEAFRLVADNSDLPDNLKCCMSTSFAEGVARTVKWFEANEEWFS